MNTTTKTIGERVRTKRESQGLSVLEAAQGARVPPHFLRDLEADAHVSLNRDLGRLRALASYLGISFRALVAAFEEGGR